MRLGLLGSAIVIVLLASASSVASAGEKEPMAPFEAEAGFSYEALSSGFSDWRSAYLDFSNRMAARKTLYGSLRWTERFKLDDEEVMAGIYFPAGRKWGMHFEGSLSSSHNVLPVYSLLGEIERMFEKGFIVHAGVRSTEYTDADTLLGILTVERYFGNFRAAYTFYESYLLDETFSASHRLQANHYYGGKNTIGLSGTIGREAEKAAPDRVLLTDVAAFSLPGVHWFNPEWAVSYEAGIHRQGDNYTKSGVRVGIRHLF